MNVTTSRWADYLKAVQATAHLRLRTFQNYQNCFRTIISEAFGVKADKSRFDYRTGGNKKWTERIDGTRLERFTPALVDKWRQQRLKAAGNSPAAIASAKRTANSYVRCARALFNREIRKKLKGVELPASLPFDGVELFESGSTKYISKVSAKALITAARNELKAHEPEVYKAFLLGLFAGMRKAEIDSLDWSMIDFHNHFINLEETEWLHLKTEGSAGQIAVNGEVLAELLTLKSGSKSEFVLTSHLPPRNDSARAYYRCEPVFKQLKSGCARKVSLQTSRYMNCARKSGPWWRPSMVFTRPPNF